MAQCCVRVKKISMSEATITAQLEITSEQGLHLRPAGCFAKLAQKYECNIEVKNGSVAVDGKSVMDLMMLAATQGSQLEVCATGADAKAAVTALQELVQQDFPCESADTTSS